MEDSLSCAEHWASVLGPGEAGLMSWLCRGAEQGKYPSLHVSGNCVSLAGPKCGGTLAKRGCC